MGEDGKRGEKKIGISVIRVIIRVIIRVPEENMAVSMQNI